MKCFGLLLLNASLAFSGASLEELRREIGALPNPVSLSGLEGRLAQAKMQFSQGNYGACLGLLAPVLAHLGDLSAKDQEEARAMAGHSKFELGDLNGARTYFSKLSDQTSLYRMIQIEAKNRDVKQLKEYYRQIKNPPDFIRYTYARALFLDGADTEAKPILESLQKSPEYGERSVYILAALLGRQGEPALASALFKSLENSNNKPLADLAKVAAARWAYMADKPADAIRIYEKLNHPNELASAQLLAGDLEPDLKRAQGYYQEAEKNASESNVRRNALIRQNKFEQALKISKVQQAEVSGLKSKLDRGDRAFFDETWAQQQPEVKRLKSLRAIILRLSQEISLLDNEYNNLEIESVGEIGWASSKYSKLALELRDLYARTESFDAKHEIEILANELSRKQVNDSDKMQAELLEAGLKLAALKAQFQKLQSDEAKLTQELIQNKTLWLARLERLTHEDDEALVRANISKRRELRQRLGQIEQLKASQIEKASQGAQK